MAYVLPQDTGYNLSAGPDQAFLYLTSQIPSLPSMLLSILFLIIMLGGYMGTKRTEGRNMLFLWWTIAGTITTIVAFMLFLIPIVPLSIVTLLFIVTIVGAILYFAT